MFTLKRISLPILPRSLKYAGSVKSLEDKKRLEDKKNFFLEFLKKIQEIEQVNLKRKNTIIFWTKILGYLILVPIILLILYCALYLWWNTYLVFMVFLELCYFTLLGESMTFESLMQQKFVLMAERLPTCMFEIIYKWTYMR